MKVFPYEIEKWFYTKTVSNKNKSSS